MSTAITRAHFLKLLFNGALFASGLGAFGRGLDGLRGDRVGWARLKTSSPIWERHSRSDPKLMQFFREHTTLNIDPTWYAADVGHLEHLCTYPFLFSQDLRPVQDDSSQRNLTEYFRRGGFVLADACINPNWRGNPDQFIAGQRQQLAKVLPEAHVAPLPNDHDIYRCFFKINGGPPHTEDGDGWGDHGLYAVQMGTRMVGIISTSGLQCGWDNMKQVHGHDIMCMQMLVNIYIYAMMQGA